jgi:hypothetical protein
MSMGREWEIICLPFSPLFLTIGFTRTWKERKSTPLTMGRSLENALPFVFFFFRIKNILKNNNFISYLRWIVGT